MGRRAGEGPDAPHRRRGRLSHEDVTLWAEVARTATPLHGQARLRGSTTLGTAPRADADTSAAPPETPAAPSFQAAAAPERGPGRAAEARVSVLRAPPDARPVGRPEPGLDSRTAQRIRRGERQPDARIDLHGMTTDRAHAALDRFVAVHAAAGSRLLLVITGKGRGGAGILRDAVPGWLRGGSHRGRILAIWQAHRRHGGTGALYIYLHKAR